MTPRSATTPIDDQKARLHKLIDQLNEPENLDGLLGLIDSILGGADFRTLDGHVADDGSGVEGYDASRRITCPQCEGAGWLGYLDTSGFFRATCTRCDGAKTIPSPVSVRCPDCLHGTGGPSDGPYCTTCKGSGRVSKIVASQRDRQSAS